MAQSPMLCALSASKGSADVNAGSQAIFFIPMSATRWFPIDIIDSRLFYFLVSLAWRLLVLTGGLDDASQPNHDLLGAAEQEWRQYLLSEDKLPQTFNVFHMVLANPDDTHNFPVKPLRGLDNFNRWFKRYTAGTAVHCEGKTVLFLKLPAVLIFVPITKHDARYLDGSVVTASGGKIPKRQRVKDEWLISILAECAQFADNRISDLSDKQVGRNAETLVENTKSDRHKQLMKDVKAASARFMKQRAVKS